MNRINRIISLLAIALACAFAQSATAGKVKITKAKGKAIVKIDGKLFTEYVFTGHSKPIMYPVIGPHGIPMTRNYPMKEGVDNEASDHPHHKSLWYTHDDVNKVQFWLEYPGKNKSLKPGKIGQQSMKIKGDTITTENSWADHAGKVVCTDKRVVSFGESKVGRHIDFTITINASAGDVTFGDTKEGTMAIRTNPLLRIRKDERRGVHTVTGKSINSEGVEGKDMWGKRAAWVDYWGQIDGKTVGVAIFDHPDNPRHPTWWHARDYGLVAANPFGVHNFEKKPKGTGDMLIKKGTSVTFTYRFLFHKGDNKSADIPAQYKAFSN
ncbi:MAG: hypothetical protein CMO80_21535 [Verrucomicrobiales bacterium]|nr:hypothetical protein [Verrucomicrobiales bacterium]